MNTNSFLTQNGVLTGSASVFQSVETTFSGILNRKLMSKAGLGCLVLLAALPTTPTLAQPCSHPTFVGVATFSTNRQGAIVFDKAHVGSTVGILIIATMTDDCPGDQTLVTNVTLSIDINDQEQLQPDVLEHPVLLPSLGCYSNIVKVRSGSFAGAAHSYVVPASAAERIINTVLLQARDTNSAANPNGLLGSTGSAQTFILRPSLAISQFCTNGVGANGVITFSGTVQNTGNTVLTNVLVLHNQPSDSTHVLGPITLASGESRGFNGAYQPVNPCAPATGVLTAYGTDELSYTVSASATRTCSIDMAPCISMSIIGGVTHLACPTESNKNYTVQFTDSPSHAPWQDLTNLTGTGSVVTIADPVDRPQRFYRFKALVAP